MSIVVAGRELSAIEFQALKVVGKEADVRRADCEAGNHAVDFEVRITGTVDVAESKLSISTTKPRPELLLAKVLDRLARGPLEDQYALHGYLRRLRGELGEPSEESIAMAKAIVDGLSGRESKPVNGAVKGSLTVARA